MACHQAHNIPWATLASHFRYKEYIGGYDGRANLFPRFRDDQGKEIHYFINAFRKTIASHAENEIARHPDIVETPGPDEVILTEAVTKRIAPSLRHATESLYSWAYEELGLDDKVLPTEFTKMKAFELPENAQREGSESQFVNIELFKLLIVYGEMEPLQKICQHPEARWAQIYNRHWDAHGDQNECGWAHIPRLALKAYISLNLLLCYPHLWDVDSGRSDKSDYRNSVCYQRMLRECTLYDLSRNIAALPHRQFLSVPEKQFGYHNWLDINSKPGRMLPPNLLYSGYPYGLLPIMDLLALEGEPPQYMPTVSAVMHVRWCLCAKGLPTELAIEIMEWAGYAPTGRLEIPHDPLHPENREELRRYLDYCFNLLVRCDVVGRWLGETMPWDRLIAEILVELVGRGRKGPSKGGRRLYESSYDYELQGYGCHEHMVYKFL